METFCLKISTYQKSEEGKNFFSSISSEYRESFRFANICSNGSFDFSIFEWEK